MYNILFLFVTTAYFLIFATLLSQGGPFIMYLKVESPDSSSLFFSLHSSHFSLFLCLSFCVRSCTTVILLYFGSAFPSLFKLPINFPFDLSSSKTNFKGLGLSASSFLLPSRVTFLTVIHPSMVSVPHPYFDLIFYTMLMTTIHVQVK